MEFSEEQSQTDHVQYQEFATYLTSLKQRGSALLVVGNLSADQYHQACQHMLGDSTAAPRRRLLITTGDTAAPPATRLPPNADAPALTATTHIRYPLQSRHATSATSSLTDRLPTEDVDAPDLSALGVTISEAIETFQDQASGLAPAELRVCFDSLRPLLSVHDAEAVFKFLHLLIGRIQAVQGMGHFHCPLERESESVRRLECLFDAIIELRRHGDTLQQKWELLNADLQSTWLRL